MKCSFFAEWTRDDSGAVTVDWTVLAAAVVGLGLATVAAVRTGTGTLATDIDTALSGAAVVSLGTLGAGNGSDEDAGGLVRDLLAATEEQYAQWLAELETWSDEDLTTLYSNYAAYTAQYIDSNDTYAAAIYSDMSAAIAQSIVTRGNTLPDGSPTIQELDARVIAMG